MNNPSVQRTTGKTDENKDEKRKLPRRVGGEEVEEEQGVS